MFPCYFYHKEYELVKFEQNELTVDVNVSPQEEIVWLTKEQASQLFDRNIIYFKCISYSEKLYRYSKYKYISKCNVIY